VQTGKKRDDAVHNFNAFKAQPQFDSMENSLAAARIQQLFYLFSVEVGCFSRFLPIFFQIVPCY
jgi:hypothetical protein